ncbi:putative Ca2+-dependent phospholipid-binding protein [Handroanthus impetiginosus]|uniref:Putative Ca2+-dependent phospholipid-binding protein n=1 Tax=Handroanthus impetiginosus TaxID=429701 RepID=A0A2G9GAL5_9LAMI|nr:putative Ca2+-dependent phospholipid-binding protein [Handroanthus impetiginosus]
MPTFMASLLFRSQKGFFRRDNSAITTEIRESKGYLQIISISCLFQELSTMAEGTLEVLLVSAKGLENTDFLSGMDPYAILTCRTQEKKSGVASGEGSCPEWNETFLFTISEGVTELKIKIMDKDTFSADDFVGEATIPLEPVFLEESIPTMSYNVVKDETYCGEIRVALKFTKQESRNRGFEGEEENLGGWRQSSFEY